MIKSSFCAELIGGPYDGRKVRISPEHFSSLWEIGIPTTPGPKGGNRYHIYVADEKNPGTVTVANYVYDGRRSGKGDSIHLSNMVPE